MFCIKIILLLLLGTFTEFENHVSLPFFPFSGPQYSLPDPSCRRPSGHTHIASDEIFEAPDDWTEFDFQSIQMIQLKKRKRLKGLGCLHLAKIATCRPTVWLPGMRLCDANASWLEKIIGGQSASLDEDDLSHSTFVSPSISSGKSCESMINSDLRELSGRCSPSLFEPQVFRCFKAKA